jgi:glutathione S-transferase
MPSLYIKDNCAYSAVVLHKLEEFNLPVEVKNINDNRYALELIEKGGRFQVPFLFDSNGNVSIYESGAILDYFDTLKTQKTDGSRKE